MTENVVPITLEERKGRIEKAQRLMREQRVDAIYIEPPEKQLYHGRAELYEFFGGEAGTDLPMKMIWHHLAFDEGEQVGFGEYTFQMHGRYHGIVVVKLEAGREEHRGKRA